MRLRHLRRSGTSVVECAVVAPLVFIFVLALMIGAIGIFRYQEVASLARRGARYAIVHGTQYAATSGNPAATPADVYNNAIKPNAVALDLNKLSYSVTWNTTNAPTHGAVVNGSPVAIQNTVTVTVNYVWIPEAYFGGVTLSSTSVMVMSF